MSNRDSNSWSEPDDLEELIASAQTREELEAALQLLTESESRLGSGADSAVENRWIVKTLGEVAAFFDVEIQTVWAWRGGANQMPGSEGRWDVQDITRWRCERLKGNVNSKSNEVLELELREKQIDIAKKELALRKSRGDLVSRAAAKAKVFEILNDARCQLEAVPGIVGAHVNPEFKDDLVNEWEQQIGLILRTMAGKAEASSA